jgi:protein SCO1/2
MKQLTIALVAALSIAAGIWFGLQSGTSGGDKPGPYDKIGGEFTLQSGAGKVSLSDFRGKVVPVYFGYTHCPDVCITSLNKVSFAMQALDEEQRARVQPIFISVDPERDTPTKASEYARYFHPSIIGLTGTPEQIAEIAKRYLVIYEKVALEGSAMDYSVDHSSIIYVVGPEGNIVSLVHHADTAESLVAYLQEAM